LIRLKADLHAHAGEDRIDTVPYSSEQLIDMVAERGYQVLAITGHRYTTYTPQLADYARERGVLLVPGVELDVEGKHVVVLNPDAEQAAATTFAELRALGRRNAAIIAPHPFYPVPGVLGSRLVKNIDLFDAVEYSSFYFRGVDFNEKAVRVAKEHGLPLLGSSDNHMLPYVDTTYSWIEVEEVSVAGVIDALRAGRITVVTKPASLGYGIRMTLFQFIGAPILLLRALRTGSMEKPRHSPPPPRP